MAEGKKLYGLLGKNIGYSLSPAMHNAAFRRFGIQAEYVLFDVETEEDLVDFIESRVRAGEISGFNVTVPYKERVKQALSRPEVAVKGKGAPLGAKYKKFVKIAGALNTVRVEDENITGYNTDVEGFCSSLEDDTGFAPKGKDVFIFGAGGAGRAIALYLAFREEKRPKRIYVHDISKAALNALKDDFEKHFRDSGVKLFAIEDAADVAVNVAKCDLVVNATPLGTKEGDPSPVDVAHLKDGAVVYDLVYARETELVKKTKEKGLVASGGLGMLVNQGAKAFEIWTGMPFDEVKKVMKEAALEELKKR